MNTITLRTNLHCNHCIDKLKPVLDAEQGIHHWSVDLSDAGQRLTVQGPVSQEQIVQLVSRAGFTAHPSDPGNTAVCTMPAPSSAATRFWQDAAVWKRASFNTLNCLAGCTIGDFITVVVLQHFFPGTPMVLQLLLPTLAGLATSVLLETSLLHYREILSWRNALTMAVSMSFLSMVAMELAMNATDFMITGGGKMPVTSLVYWLAFIPAAVAGFLAPLPYNYYQLKRHNKACH